MKELSLYGLTNEIDALDSLLEQDHGEMTDEWVALLNEVSLALTEKTDNCASYYEMQKDFIELIDKKIKELKTLKERNERKLDRFSGYVQFCMEKMGIQKIQGQLKEIKFRKPLKKVEVINDDKVPQKYLTGCENVLVRYWDKVAIKKDFENGEIIDGVQVIEGKKSLIVGYKKGN